MALLYQMWFGMKIMVASLQCIQRNRGEERFEVFLNLYWIYTNLSIQLTDLLQFIYQIPTSMKALQPTSPGVEKSSRSIGIWWIKYRPGKWLVKCLSWSAQSIGSASLLPHSHWEQIFWWHINQKARFTWFQYVSAFLRTLKFHLVAQTEERLFSTPLRCTQTSISNHTRTVKYVSFSLRNDTIPSIQIDAGNFNINLNLYNITVQPIFIFFHYKMKFLNINPNLTPKH